MRWAVLALGMICAFSPQRCRASVERFAIIVGNDRGLPGETPLQYATSDATRVYDVLRDLGGFQPVNMVLLQDESADTLRRTLITVNDRIRAAISTPGAQALLFVYYSGRFSCWQRGREPSSRVLRRARHQRRDTLRPLAQHRRRPRGDPCRVRLARRSRVRQTLLNCMFKP